MSNLSNHASNGRDILVINSLVDMPQPQSLQIGSDIRSLMKTASQQRHSNHSHVVMIHLAGRSRFVLIVLVRLNHLF